MENNFKCTYAGCKAAFSKNSKLVIHSRKHSGERPFQCDEEGCDKSYTNSSHLRRHKKVSHAGEIKTEGILCDHIGCGMVLANKYSLKKHVNRKHNLEKYPFVCSECLQGFHRKKQLQTHCYLHTGEPPFKCDKCPRGYTSNSRLNRHKKTHKLHKCEDCGEEFETWSSFTAHRRRCKKPKYNCKTCNKKFYNLANLKSHKLVHIDLEDRNVFVCTYKNCDRFYFYKKNLIYHINDFHKLLPRPRNFPCTYPKCPFQFSTTQRMKIHLSTHFKWNKNVVRKTRCDKGKHKKQKSTVSLLTDKIDILLETEIPQLPPPEENSETQFASSEDNLEKAIDVDLSDDPILRAVDLALQRLHGMIE